MNVNRQKISEGRERRWREKPRRYYASEMVRFRPARLSSVTSITKRISIVAFLLLALSPARGPGRAPEVVRYEASHDTMGTTFIVVAYGADAGHLAAIANEVFNEFDAIDAQMSHYRPESELSAINRHAAVRGVIVEPGLFRLLRESLRYSQETEGAFDITVGPLMKAWGFFRGQGRGPSDRELAEARLHVGFRHVRLDEESRTIRFAVEGLGLDLGGIGKGYAVDRAVEILKSYGVENAMVSSGTSSLYALGAPPGERAWRVSLRDPFDSEKVADVVWLRDFALSMSGSYEKFFTLEGRTYSHIFDPRTGRPVEGMLATTVLAPRATEADALSTAFYVLGPEGTRRVLAAHANLVSISYLPFGEQKRHRRVMLRSDSFTPANHVVVEVEEAVAVEPTPSRK
jgi:thiamine biosynthesis lipoprotein